MTLKFYDGLRQTNQLKAELSRFPDMQPVTVLVTPAMRTPSQCVRCFNTALKPTQRGPERRRMYRVP